LRALLTPQRLRERFRGRGRPAAGIGAFDAAGRWALIDGAGLDPVGHTAMAELRAAEGDAPPAPLRAERADGAFDPDHVDAAAVEHAARALLRRYGVVCRAILGRESLAPSWRVLLDVYRRWEARGEIRGGRFIAPLGGEQFALPEAVAALRKVRRQDRGDEWVAISAADPLNFAHLTGTASRTPAVPWRQMLFRRGKPVAAKSAAGIEWLDTLTPA